MKKATLATRLRAAREEANMSQKELADRASQITGVRVDSDRISKIERGLIEQPRDILLIAEAVGKSPGWLMFGDSRLDELSPEAVEVALAWDRMTIAERDALRPAVLRNRKASTD